MEEDLEMCSSGEGMNDLGNLLGNKRSVEGKLCRLSASTERHSLVQACVSIVLGPEKQRLQHKQ